MTNTQNIKLGIQKNKMTLVENKAKHDSNHSRQALQSFRAQQAGGWTCRATRGEIIFLYQLYYVTVTFGLTIKKHIIQLLKLVCQNYLLNEEFLFVFISLSGDGTLPTLVMWFKDSGLDPVYRWNISYFIFDFLIIVFKSNW